MHTVTPESIRKLREVLETMFPGRMGAKTDSDVIEFAANLLSMAHLMAKTNEGG